MSNEITQKAKEILELQAERTSLRTMADYVKEYLIAYCDEDPEFTERVNSSEKTFMDCIGFIKKKALEWLKEQQNMELSVFAQGIGGEVPPEICYGWAVEYYYSKPEPKPEPKKVETVTKTKVDKKEPTGKKSQKGDSKNLQISLLDSIHPENSDKTEPTHLFGNTDGEETADDDPDLRFGEPEVEYLSDEEEADLPFYRKDEIEYLTDEEEADLPQYKEAV